MRRVLFALLLAWLIGAPPARASDPALSEWSAYRARFITPSGRVLDTGNADISHSEGQGYAMLLALAFDDRSSFVRLWRWTRETLQVRDDALLAWLFDPRRSAHGPSDLNAASDGDLLVAWALSRAGRKWRRPDYLAEARRILDDVRDKLVVTVAERPVLLPGPDGFVHEAVTVNLSYWVFPALHDLARLHHEPLWRELAESGLDLLRAARFGRHGLPPDWLLLTRPLRPSPLFEPVFGYNAVRIPLYLAWAGIDDSQLLAPYLKLARASDGQVPAIVDLTSGATRDRQSVGAAAAFALADHAAGGAPAVLPELDVGRDEYYAATLLLLAKLATKERLFR